MVKIRTRRATSADRQAGGSAPGATPEADAAATTTATDDGHSDGSEAGDAGSSQEATEGITSLGEETSGELSLSFDDLTADDDDAPAPAPRRGRKPGPKPKGKRSHHKKKTVTQIFEEPPAQKLDRKMAGILLQIVEGITVPQLGEHARFEPDERKLIEPPLANLIERLTPESAKMFSQFADPVMLGFGLLVWGARVFSVPRQAPAPRPRPTLLRREAAPTQPSPGAAPAQPPDQGPSETVADIATEWSM